MTYAELKTAIAAWLERDDLTSYLDTFIDFAESTFKRRLRCRQMETETELTVDAAYEALPTGFLETRYVYVDADINKALSYVTPERLYETYAGSVTGEPRVYTIIGSNIHFGPAPDSEYAVQLGYYKFTPLDGDNTTNWLGDDYPDVYLYTSLAAAEAFCINDERAAMFKMQSESLLNELEQSDAQGKIGASLQVRVG